MLSGINVPLDQMSDTVKKRKVRELYKKLMSKSCDIKMKCIRDCQAGMWCKFYNIVMCHKLGVS